MKKGQLINLFLVLGVIIGTFITLEFFIENFLITQTPIKFQFALPRGLAVLAQSSKSKRIPDNYIAIVGDSYAQGKGDWLLSIDTNSNDAFNSAHALQNLTKHDVINYGKSGASNIRGWVREPIARSQFIHKHIDKSLKHPKIILAYFYAGNDLQENILDVRESFIPQYGQKSLNDNDVWNDFFQKSIENYKVSPFSGNKSNLGWFPRASFKILKNEFCI